MIINKLDILHIFIYLRVYNNFKNISYLDNLIQILIFKYSNGYNGKYVT